MITDQLLALCLGIPIGILAGLLPSVTPAMALLIFIAMIHLDPVSLIIFAITIGIGSQFFGNIAVLYYRFPGETSSFPTMLESNNFKTASQIKQVIAITTRGSFVASVLATLMLIFLVSSGVLSDLRVPISAKGVVYVVILLMVLISPIHKILSNFFILLLMMAVGNYSMVTRLSDGWLPVYHIEEMLGLIIIFTMQMIWKRFKITDFIEIKSSSHTTASLLWRPWITKYLAYAVLGWFGGLIPQAGATISAYTAYFVEKLRAATSINRVAAAETANNSAIISAWAPFLLFGIPITASEIILLDYFAVSGLDFKKLLLAESLWIIGICLIVASIIFAFIASIANDIFYQFIGKILSTIWFPIVVMIIAVGGFVLVANISWHALAIHLAIFVPLSWLLRNSPGLILIATVGLILSSQMIFTFIQLYQIYF
jgi:putative tricarboxylic transport membrane protein